MGAVLAVALAGALAILILAAEASKLDETLHLQNPGTAATKL